MVSEFSFGGIKGFEVDNGTLKLRVLELGATVYGLEFAGRNVALHHDSPEVYMASASYVGGLVGRFANRIADASFTVDGCEYKLNANNGKNTLHGGEENLDLHKRLWHGEIAGENAVSFTAFLPDGDNGFPGNLDMNVVYTLDGERLTIEMSGTSDKTTAFGPTSHIYFNLDGAETVLDTVVSIDANSYVESNAELIPTGRLLPAEGSFDFKAPRPIAGSYDHCFVLNSEHAMTAEAGGIRMSIDTDYPGIQLYTGDFLDSGFKKNAGFAAEPEFFPDSPNHPEFPFEFLRAGETMTKHIVYTFEKV